MPRPKIHSFVKSLRVVSLALIAAASAAAYAHGGHASAKEVKATPEELDAYEEAKPAFERHCFRCHTAAGRKVRKKALEHMSMDGYPFGGHHAGDAGEVVRKVLGAGGSARATMPADDRGAVTGEDLAKIVAWAAAFDRARHSEAAHPKDEEGGHHAH